MSDLQEKMSLKKPFESPRIKPTGKKKKKRALKKKKEMLKRE